MRDYSSVREDAALIDLSTTSFLLRVRGNDLLGVLARVFVGKIGTLRPNVATRFPLLDEQQRVVDLLLLANRRDHCLIGGSVARDRTVSLLRSAGLQVEDVTSSWRWLHVEGPFAWRYAKAVVGPHTVGLRPMTGTTFDIVDGSEGFCLRTTLAGEYGFSFFVPVAASDGIRAALASAGCDATFTWPTLQVLAHEVRAPLFDITVPAGICPVAAGIKYMLDLARDDLDALRILRARAAADGGPRAVAYVEGPNGPPERPEVLSGAPVHLEGEPCGEVLREVRSPRLGRIGLALLAADVAYPGCDAFTVGGAPARTTNAPLLMTRSHEVRMS